MANSAVMSHNQIEIMYLDNDYYERALERIANSDLPNKEQLLEIERKSKTYRFVELERKAVALYQSQKVADDAYAKIRQELLGLYRPQGTTDTEIILRAIVDKTFALRLKNVFMKVERLQHEQQTANTAYSEYANMFWNELKAEGGTDIIDDEIRTRAIELSKLLDK
jgi:folate-binding Fe-S cluster repair protein YgfZ